MRGAEAARLARRRDAAHGGRSHRSDRTTPDRLGHATGPDLRASLLVGARDLGSRSRRRTKAGARARRCGLLRPWLVASVQLVAGVARWAARTRAATGLPHALGRRAVTRCQRI